MEERHKNEEQEADEAEQAFGEPDGAALVRSANAALVQAEEKAGVSEEEIEEEQAAADLGSERYVLAGFFATGMLGAYVLGRAIQATWMELSNKDWFSRAVPAIAAVGEDDKQSIALAIAAAISIVVTFRTYRKPSVRSWADEVASELAKVKWPTRKEVSNSTMIVIAASAAATLYLALLDRLWAFMTNLVYGDGS